MTQAEFLARAWKLANDRARELGWISRENEHCVCLVSAWIAHGNIRSAEKTLDRFRDRQDHDYDE